MRIYHQDMILFCPDQKKRAAKAIQSVLCYHVNDTAQKQCRVYTLPEHNSYQKSYPWHMVSVSSVEMISSLPQISQCHVSSFSQVSITSVPYTWCVLFSHLFLRTQMSVYDRIFLYEMRVPHDDCQVHCDGMFLLFVVQVDLKPLHIHMWWAEVLKEMFSR